MYYQNLTNTELQLFKGLTVPNFTIKLTDALTSGLFKVDTIITGSVYKLYPLFYTNEITTTNPNDIVMDDLCLLCEKQSDKETYITCISDSDDSDIQDYANYTTYKNIGDSLTTNEYNGLISLLRYYNTHNDTIRINDTVTGDFGFYEFDIDDTTVLDTGIVVTDETITAEPKVRLSNPLFHNSTYTLKLSILHYTGVNIIDDETDNYKVVDTLSVDLEKDTWVDIPVDDIEQGYIISLDAVVDINHDKTIIQNWVTSLTLSGTPEIIQSGEVADLIATATDDVQGVSGQTIYFYEVFTPSINLTGDKSIIQTSDVVDLSAKVKDEDGRLVSDETVYFYRIIPPIIEDNTEYTVSNETKWLHELGDLSDNWRMECKFKTTGESRVYIGNKATATGNPNYSVFVGSPNGTNIAYYGYRTTSTTPTDINNYNVTEYSDMIIERDGSTFTFILNGVEYTKTIDWFDDYSDFVLAIVNWSGTTNVKDIKFYDGDD